MAGPAVILSYALGGFIAFLIMRQLGEMMAQEPVAGSFSNLAHKYWGDFPGLLSGWNYWILYVLVGMSELTAVAVYVQYWFPSIRTVANHGLFLSAHQRHQSGACGRFRRNGVLVRLIKVVAIVAAILLGGFLLLGPDTRANRPVSPTFGRTAAFSPRAGTGCSFPWRWCRSPSAGLSWWA